ncbi:MFS-type transporter SLC18B1-like [Sycon ciliatum]|uniref:MFS-type transporter SLC18B1-like n=1 Tax=Sycon ciliatum TaxID=27933 RepID=UPI0031F6FC2D
MTYLTRLYPENLGFVNSCLVTSLSLGHSIGTLLSGVLYDVGGFNLPFIVTGAIAFLVSAGVAVFLVDSDKLEKEEQKQPEKTGNAREAAAVAETHLGTFAVLRVPWALYLLFLAIAATFAYSALEAVLSREMSLRLGVSTTVIGVALSFLFIQGALFGPIGGKLLDKGIDRNVTFSVGLVLMGLGCLLVGPASFLHLPHSLPLVIVSLFVFGVGRIISVMTVHVALAEHLRDIGVGTVVETRVPVSGLTRVFLSIGFMCGPLVVSPLVAVLGFQAAFTGLGLVYVFLAGPLLLKAAAGSRILERLMACICTLYRNRVDVNDSKTQQPIDDITELQPLKH